MRSLLVLALTAHAAVGAVQKPNIIFFLTDDQDQVLGASFPNDGTTPMSYTQKEFADKGSTAQNFFIHTPICCPSRSEMLTGRYFHNLLRRPTNSCPAGLGPGGGPSGSPTDVCCMHIDENLVNNQTSAVGMKKVGYTTGYFGKYLNVCPDADHKPKDWDTFFANGGGHYYAPEFATVNVPGLKDGKIKYGKDVYSTSIIANMSMAWLRQTVEQKQEPFFQIQGYKAAHQPFSPAPWYTTHWDPAWPEHEPRPESWNCSQESRKYHHESIATNNDILTEVAADFITATFKDRWRTLMSVDDAIRGTFELCDELKITDHTYFFYSSDHGFQLGEFNILADKRNVYDHDTRIHLLAKGPGIKAGSKWEQLATQVDLTPTFLDLAGADPTTTFGDLPVDGRSLVPLLVTDLDAELPVSVAETLAKTDVAGTVAGWRDSVFIEYYYVGLNDYMPGDGHTYKTEDPSNNFIALRSMNEEFGNTLYAEFQTQNDGQADFATVDHVEYFNLANDPWEMHNLNATADPKVTQKLHDKLRSWYACSGKSCP